LGLFEVNAAHVSVPRRVFFERQILRTCLLCIFARGRCAICASNVDERLFFSIVIVYFYMPIFVVFSVVIVNFYMPIIFI
jgi:hypothetical protein